jgi:hypothetical protein
MRTIGIAAIVVGLALAPGGRLRADEQAEGVALIDKAIKAMGGQDRLTKFQGQTWKAKGSFQEGGAEITFTSDISVQGEDKYRWDLEVTVQGRSVTGNLVINGAKGWMKEGNSGTTQEIPKEFMPVLKEDFQAVRLAQRLLALKAKGVRLAPLGELKIGGRPALGVKATRKGFNDIDLYFDKETLLPVKAEIRLKEFKESMEVVHEFIFGDCKEVKGIKQFTKLKVKRDGKKLLEMELSDIDPQEKLDDAVFDKP